MVAWAKTRTFRLAAVAAVILSCLAAMPWFLGGQSEAARRQWKDEAIPVIAQRAADTNWHAQEIAILTTGTPHDRVLAEGWLTDKMILMESGEWLVYKSHCSKEKPRRIKDIFLAKGSDGKWYYSTFHFCVGMVVLRGEEKPPDLALFVHEYNLCEFDGRSDDCLKETGSFPASWRNPGQSQ